MKTAMIIKLKMSKSKQFFEHYVSYKCGTLQMKFEFHSLFIYFIFFFVYDYYYYYLGS